MSNPVPRDETTSKLSHKRNAFPRHLLRVESQPETDNKGKLGQLFSLYQDFTQEIISILGCQRNQ